MDAQEFYDLVTRMRAEQIAYHASKRGGYLREAELHLHQAKLVEQQVDFVIRVGKSMTYDQDQSAFFDLVAEMRREQIAYYGNIYATGARQHLVNARALESRVNKLLVPTTVASADEQRQLRLHLEDERDAGEA